MDFKRFKTQEIQAFDEFLKNSVEKVSDTQLENAMNYSLNANGKRLRPLLLLSTLHYFGYEVKAGYEAASALEMVHTYSLIHDDLPAMDNDNLRRGVPTNHIQFSEPTAILAGDSLLTLAFELLTKSSISSEKIISLVSLLSETSGHKGMVGGQQSDINGENKEDLSIEELEFIHSRKTGELIRFALVGGGIIAGQKERVLQKLASISKQLGIAYQIRDDVLDVIGTEEELGKAIGADEKLGKSTYPSLLGLSEAKGRLTKELDSVKDSLNEIAEETQAKNPEVLTSFIDQLYLKEQ